MRLLIFSVAFVTFNVSLNSFIADACICSGNSHRQDVYCKDDTYAIHGTIMAKQPPVNESDPQQPEKIYYVVRVDNELKKIPDIASVVDIGDVKLITIETSGSEGLCGVSHLDVGDSYELTGYIDGESFGITSCDIQGIWDDVDEYTRGYYRNGYYDCECEVLVNSFPEGTGNPDYCYGSIPDAICIRDYGICTWIKILLP